tara:strand:+ start:1488 stop:2840 length:1353 start_codon:yes stop_codon:yes gene_type:complete
MIKKVKYLIFFLLFILIVACSFGDRSGIWTGSEEEKRRMSQLERDQQGRIEVIKIHKAKTIYSKEIPAVKNAVLTTPQKNNSWQMPGLNLQNFAGNIYLPNIENNFLKKKIGKNKFPFSKLISTPLILKNNIILTDDTGTIFNINLNGKLNWKKNIYKKVYKKIYKNLTFSVYKDKIYIADNIGFIYAVSLENGKLIWIKNHGVGLRSKIKVFDDKIFLINQDNRVICISIEEGSKIWDFRSVSSFIKSQQYSGLAISKKGELVLLSSSGDLLKIDTSFGRVYWSLNTTDSMLAHDTDFFASSDIVIAENNIIFSTLTSTFSYNLNNGYRNWKASIGSKNTPIVDGENVFLISDNGYFVNLDKRSGTIIWSTNILKVLKKKNQKTQITGFIMGSGKIYAVSKNGHLIVCSAVTGKIEYFRKIGDPITTSPIISNESLYILTKRSRIFGFN